MSVFLHRLQETMLLGALAALAAGCNSPPTPTAMPKKGAKVPLVETAPARLGEESSRIERTGTLQARRIVQLVNEEEGLVLKLPYHEGDRVEAGGLVLQLDDRILQAELKKAQANRRQAKLDLGRLERLKKKQLVAEEELARGRTALAIAAAEEQLLRTRLDRTRIGAPFDGVISARLTEPGEVLPRFTHVLTLIDPDSLTIEVPVSELVLPTLAIGDAAEVRIDALGGETFVGKILRIYPQVDPATRQGTVEVALEPVPEGVRPGQFGRVTLVGRPRSTLTIPFSALRRDSVGQYVFRIDEEGRARRAAVISGRHLGDRIEIIDGLQRDQLVVIKGFMGLSDGSAVRQPDGNSEGADSQGAAAGT